MYIVENITKYFTGGNVIFNYNKVSFEFLY